jgi:CheY-like chemotaxis protein/HPt (histidine-containing phosphotransfer) domain-containing protein
MTAANMHPMIDQGRLAAFAHGSLEAQNRIVAEFRQCGRVDAQGIRDACARADFMQINELAHRMKGACMMLGATNLSEACSLLAMAARAGDHAQALSGLEFFNREFQSLDQFLSTLPAPESMQQQTQPAHDALPCAQLRFLVADDHDFQRALITRLLLRLGAAHVAHAEDGESALRVLNDATRPEVDIVVLDLSMPGVSGLELIRILGQARSGVSLILNSALSPSQLNSVIFKTAASPVRILGIVTKPLLETHLTPLLAKFRAAREDRAAGAPH